jgi:hypothetical protein
MRAILECVACSVFICVGICVCIITVPLWIGAWD